MNRTNYLLYKKIIVWEQGEEVLFQDENRTPEQYRSAFERMFGCDTVETAWRHINGEQRFHGLQAGDLGLSQFPLHQQLLAAYQKLQQAKV